MTIALMLFLEYTPLRVSPRGTALSAKFINRSMLAPRMGASAYVAGGARGPTA